MHSRPAPCVTQEGELMPPSSPPTARVVRIVEMLAAAMQPKTVSEIAASTGISRATATAVVNELEAAGWVARDDELRYRIGASLPRAVDTSMPRRRNSCWPALPRGTGRCDDQPHQREGIDRGSQGAGGPPRCHRIRCGPEYSAGISGRVGGHAVASRRGMRAMAWYGSRIECAVRSAALAAGVGLRIRGLSPRSR